MAEQMEVSAAARVEALTAASTEVSMAPLPTQCSSGRNHTQARRSRTQTRWCRSQAGSTSQLSRKTQGTGLPPGSRPSSRCLHWGSTAAAKAAATVERKARVALTAEAPVARVKAQMEEQMEVSMAAEEVE